MTESPDDHAATRRGFGDRVSRRRRTRPGVAVTTALLSATLGLGLAGCGGSGSHTPSTATTPPPPPIHATLTAPTHTPKVNAPWHYVVRVTNGAGQPVAAVVHLQAMLQGDPNPVGQIGVHKVSNGVWAETIEWPPASANQPLVFQVLATALGQTVTINYPIRISPA